MFNIDIGHLDKSGLKERKDAEKDKRNDKIRLSFFGRFRCPDITTKINL